MSSSEYVSGVLITLDAAKVTVLCLRPDTSAVSRH